MRSPVIVLLCAALLFFVLFLLSIQYVGMAKFSRKELFVLLQAVVISGVILSYFVNPPIEWDLYRHHEAIRKIADSRKWGGSYKGNYEDLPVATALFFLVSFLPSVHYLQAIAVATVGFVVLYILKDYSKSIQTKDNSWILVAFFCSVAYVNIVMSLSGVRNTMAAAIATLGVYLGIRKNRRIIALLLCAVSAGLHPQTIVILLLYLINRLFCKTQIKMQWMSLFAWPLIVQVSALLENSGNAYIRYVLALLSIYQEDDVLIDTRIVLVQIVAVVGFLLSIWRASRRTEFVENPGLEYFAMMKIYLFAVLGSLGNNLLFYRMLYPIGILMIPQIHCMIAGEKNKSRKILTTALLTVLWGGLLLYTMYELYGALI